VADKIDFDTKKILREEEKPKLFSIGVDFYMVAENYVCDLESESKIYNTNNTKGKILYDQLISTKENIKSIIIHRMRKIVRDAQTATFSDERNKQGPDNLTPEERELFDVLYEKLTEWKDTHLDSIVSRKREAVTEIVAVPVCNPMSVALELHNDDCQVKEIIVKDYIILRMLKNIPTFVGIDSRQYTLAKEDLVSVPTVNGNALISRSAAVRIENR